MAKTETPEPASAAAPRSRKGAQTRARLLESAKVVFEDTGFLEARISDIAEKAGLSHGSFYHYFDSKEQIFREVAEVQEALLTAPPEEAEAAEAESDNELDRIRRANRRYLKRYGDNAKIMGVIEEVSRYDDHVNEARMRRQKHFADRAERAIRRLQKDGAADPDVDPEIAALALGSMVARVAELWLVEQWGDYDLDTVADQVTRLWANAIKPEGLTHEVQRGRPRPRSAMVLRWISSVPPPMRRPGAKRNRSSHGSATGSSTTIDGGPRISRRGVRRQPGVLGVQELGDRPAGRDLRGATRACTRSSSRSRVWARTTAWRTSGSPARPSSAASARSCVAERALVPPPIAARSLASIVRSTAKPPPSSPMSAVSGTKAASRNTSLKW